MGTQDDEKRRLQQLRDEQLRARDPTAKNRATHQRISARHRGARRRLTIQQIISDLPAKWLWMIVGGLLGLAVALTMNLMIPGDPLVRAVSLIIFVFGIVVGRLVGAVRDWGDEDWGRKY